MPTNTSSLFTSAASIVSGLKGIVSGMEQVASQIAPAFLCVAFVLLVFGTMRGFLQHDLRHFFGNLLRVIFLVALISNWQIPAGIVTGAVSAFCSLQITANFGSLTNNANTTTTARLDIQQLAAIIQQKVDATTGTTAGQVKPGGQTLIQKLISPITHALCQVLYSIFLLALLLSELVVVLMELLQQCIVVFLALYVPIGFAEFSIPNLRGQAEAFFKNYIGVQCWPVGWVFVNIVTVALFRNLPSPNPENTWQLLIAIVWSVPVFLWVVIGHILAPFYAQKIVMRGGAELQAFAGAMIAAVGGTAGSFYGGAFAVGRKGVNWLDRHSKPKSNRGQADSKFRPFGDTRHQWPHLDGEQSANDNHGFGAGDLLGSLVPGLNQVKRAESENKGNIEGFGKKARGFGFWSLNRAMDAGEFGMRTTSNLADTVGSLVADASSNRIGPERGFSFPRIRRSQRNRSSQRAADYLNYQDY